MFDEPKAVAAMKERGLTDYVSETLTPLFWNSAAKQIAKEGKTDIEGLVIQEKATARNHKHMSMLGIQRSRRPKVKSAVAINANVKPPRSALRERAGDGVAERAILDSVAYLP